MTSSDHSLHAWLHITIQCNHDLTLPLTAIVTSPDHKLQSWFTWPLIAIMTSPDHKLQLWFHMNTYCNHDFTRPLTAIITSPDHTPQSWLHMTTYSYPEAIHLILLSAYYIWDYKMLTKANKEPSKVILASHQWKFSEKKHHPWVHKISLKSKFQRSSLCVNNWDISTFKVP